MLESFLKPVTKAILLLREFSLDVEDSVCVHGILRSREIMVAEYP